MKKKILIFIDWYLPGYKAGGPIKSIAAMVSHFHQEFDFYIITTDKDYGEVQPYQNIKSNEWILTNDSVHIYYISQEQLNYSTIRRLANSETFHCVYLNSYFSAYFSLYPLLMSRFGKLKSRIVLAPRGMLGAGALKLKSLKKNVFIATSKILKLHRGIIWHATSTEEANEIRLVYGKEANIITASNLQYKLDNDASKPTVSKKIGELNLFFLSRITEKKNLIYAIQLLKQLELQNEKIAFSIIGPIEDKLYWAQCSKLIETLPQQITVNYLGAIPNNQIAEYLANSHFLFLPTLNENYGHVIVESLMNGKPLILSDQTPWRELEKKKIGWDISLKNNGEFLEAIRKCISMNESDYQMMSHHAYEYVQDYINNPELINQSRSLFL